MKEVLGNYAPELEENVEAFLDTVTEHFDHDFNDDLSDNVNIDTDDEDNFSTASKNINDVATS